MRIFAHTYMAEADERQSEVSQRSRAVARGMPTPPSLIDNGAHAPWLKNSMRRSTVSSLMPL